MASGGLHPAAGRLDGQAVASAHAELALGGDSRLLAVREAESVMARRSPLAANTDTMGWKWCPIGSPVRTRRREARARIA